MKFKLEIALDNDAMKTGEDVAKALRHHADIIAGWGGNLAPLADGSNLRIRDANGNTVGKWKVVR